MEAGNNKPPTTKIRNAPEISSAVTGSLISLKHTDNTPDFLAPWDLGDIAFCVQGRYVYASRTILAMWSPVMKAMFYDEFKEKYAAEIVLPGKHFEDILELVRVTHPPNKDLDESNIGILLPLAREYQMEDLTRRCERFLLTRPPSVQALVLAEEFCMDDLKIQCMGYIHTSRLQDLTAEEEFGILHNETKVKILLEKSMMYEEFVCQVRDIIEGRRPEQVRFRAGGTLCTFTCPDKETPRPSGRLPHNAGTDRTCRSCSLSMTEKIADRLRRIP